MKFFLIFQSEIFHRAALVTMHARDWTEQARTLQWYWQRNPMRHTIPLANWLRLPATRLASRLDAWPASAARCETLVAVWPPRAHLRFTWQTSLRNSEPHKSTQRLNHS